VKSREAVYTEAILGIRSIWNSRRINALPDNWEGAQMAFQYDIGETHQANATRSVKWLEENGKCVDHIYPGQSTIEGAGHGAFSKRYLPEGTVITGSPLLHIPEKDEFMPQYHFDDKEDNFHREKIVFGHQLMMNYCFGHTETTLMLCPCEQSMMLLLFFLFFHNVIISDNIFCSSAFGFQRWSWCKLH
jgi:hypothetical protein